MIRITITAAALEAIAATLLTALLLPGTASARAETIHGALGKAYGTHDLDQPPLTGPFGMLVQKRALC
jgi:hypothetical protein